MFAPLRQLLDRDTLDATLVAGISLARPASRSATTVDVLITSEQVAERPILPQSWIEEATRQGRILLSSS
jgi:hypothetical protein